MKNLTKKDMILLIVSLFFLILTVVGFVVVLLNSDLYNNNDNNIVDVETGGQPKVNPDDIQSDLVSNIDDVKFEYISFEQIEEIKDERFIVVITKEDCPACERFMNNLKIFKSKYTSISIYLIDYNTLSTEQKQEFPFVPGYLFYNNGKQFYAGKGNVEAEKLYEKFTSNLKED